MYRLVEGLAADLGSGDASVVGDGVDELLVEISQFVTGEVRLPAPERQLMAILFTDLVDSTRLAVNIAARVMALAGMGQILTTELVGAIAETAKFTGLGGSTSLRSQPTSSKTAGTQALVRLRRHTDLPLQVRRLMTTHTCGNAARVGWLIGRT